MSMRILFDPTDQQIALAMAFDARDEHTDADFGEFVPEDPVFVEHVEKMTKREALAALRSCLWAYGAMSWPEDYPLEAYRVALRRVHAWFASPATHEEQRR